LLNYHLTSFMESAAIDSDDAVELRIKLAYSQRRLEESEGLVYKLKESLQQSIEQADSHSARVATLKQVQESLLADKLNAERRVALLMKEKAELAAENASLRTSAKDSQRASQISALADAALEHSAASASSSSGARSGSGTGTSLLSIDSSSNINTSAVRSLVVRLLETCHRHGFSLSLNELTAPINHHYHHQQHQQQSSSSSSSSTTTGSSSSLSQGQAAAAAGTRAARAELIEALAESLGVLDEVRVRAADGFRSSSPFRLLSGDMGVNNNNSASGLNGGGGGGNSMNNETSVGFPPTSTRNLKNDLSMMIKIPSEDIDSSSSSEMFGQNAQSRKLIEGEGIEKKEVGDPPQSPVVTPTPTSSSLWGRVWNILVS